MKAEEIAQRIMSVLEEFSHDNLFAIVNTVWTPTGASEEIRAFLEATRHLVSDGSLELALQAAGQSSDILPTDKADQLLSRYAEHFAFDQLSLSWTLANDDVNVAQIPVAYLTSRGRGKAETVLARRGYRWWEMGSH